MDTQPIFPTMSASNEPSSAAPKPTTSGSSTARAKGSDGSEALKRAFPTGPDLLRWACAANWRLFASGDYARLASKPCPKLGALAGIYHMSGIATSLARQNIAHVAMMSSTRFQPSDASLDTAAQLFVGKYSRTCTVYMLMTYFANYLTDYKRTVGTFDLGDLLSGYRIFEDRWRTAMGKALDAVQHVSNYSSNLVGLPAKQAYIQKACQQHGTEDYINEGTRPYDPASFDPQVCRMPRYGALIRWGSVTPEQVRQIAAGQNLAGAIDNEPF